MQTIRPVKISSLGHLSTSHKAGNGEMEGTGRKERLEEEEGVGTREGDIDQTAGFARCSFSTFHHPLPSTLQHRDTLLDSLDWGGGRVSVPGQAEFTYLFAGSRPDFTKDIGGR